MRAAGFAVIVGILIAGLGFLVRIQWDPLIRTDNAITASATDFTRAHPAFRSALLVWETISQPKWCYPLFATPVCVWAWLRLRLTTRAWWAFGTMMIAWSLAAGLKYVFRRARPLLDDPVSHAPGYSFPSGHAAGAATITTALVLLLWPVLTSTTARLAALGAAVAWTATTASDRVFLGVHYFSDVLGGMVFGTGLVLASYAGFIGWSAASLTPDSLKGD